MKLKIKKLLGFLKIKKISDFIISTIGKIILFIFHIVKDKLWPRLTKLLPFLKKLEPLLQKIKPTSKKGKIIFISIFVLLFAIFGFAVKKIFFSKKAAAAEESKLFSVRVKPAKKENFSDKYTVMGTIKGAIENELRFEMDGILSSYNFNEGDKVKKGQVLCSLDPKDAMTKVDYAKSRHQSERSAYFSASQRLKVYEELYAMNALSESKIQEARYETMSADAKMKAALSELELAQSNLSKTSLLAPDNGLLAQIIIRPGEYITQHDVVAKFISGVETNFEVDVPEKDVNNLKVGQKVKINCDAYQNKDFIGKVAEIAPTVKERTRSTTVKIDVPNPDGELRSGMFGRGVIYLKELENVFIVPQESIITLGASTYLLPLLKPDELTKGEGTIELRNVKVGDKVENKAIIEDGLVPEELIVVETQGQLSDGIRVKYSIIEDKAEENQPAAQE
ncbi:MAG: efflux RND transporter periplasmic adaptor subunit [Elusimicrobia bacterium]|nr:efflux RND transporter periplasmic adaptor subunit [Candidatus Liberimonas magnetica]